jgi:hypothetical protein
MDVIIGLCIELGSWDMINIDKVTNVFLTIKIDSFLVM